MYILKLVNGTGERCSRSGLDWNEQNIASTSSPHDAARLVDQGLATLEKGKDARFNDAMLDIKKKKAAEEARARAAEDLAKGKQEGKQVGFRAEAGGFGE